MRTILRRLSRRHSTAVAYLALSAALGGSAYAAVTVTGQNIKDGTITGRDVKNRPLDTNKLSKKALASLNRSHCLAGWEYAVLPGVAVPSNSHRSAQVDCPGGKKALGGGGSAVIPAGAGAVALAESAPSDPRLVGW